MARGVSETEVFAAAEAVLAGGAKPTIERVRQHLGRGSPATVARLLEAWWDGLVQRINATRVAGLPELPGAVGQAMASLWQSALDAARESLDEECRRRTTELDQRASALDGRESEFVAAGAALAARAQNAERALERSELTVAEQSRTIAGLEAAHGELWQRIAQSEQQAATLRQQCEAVRVAETDARAEAKARERELEAHWLQEVDRARQAQRRVETQLDQHRHAAERGLAQAQATRDAALARAAKAEAQIAGLTAARDRQEAEIERLVALGARRSARATPRARTARTAPGRASRKPR